MSNPHEADKSEFVVLARLRRENRQLRATLEELKQLREAAHRDPLTGLRNRRLLDERLKEELGRLGRTPDRAGSLLILDVNHFKSINDRYGHLAGDNVLRQLASLLTATLRLEDLCCRTGGDEFAILLPETPADGALRAADRIRAALRLRNTMATITFDAAIGQATWPDDGCDPTSVRKAADAAMYSSKAMPKPVDDGTDRGSDDSAGQADANGGLRRRGPRLQIV